MAPGSKDHAGEDLWELTVDDLLSSPVAPEREPEPSAPGPYVVDLSVGIEPFCVLGRSLADFDHLHTYQVTDWQDDRLVFRLRLGPIESELEADMILTVVRRDYPNASSLLATDDDFRMISIVAASAKPRDAKPRKAQPAAPTPAPDVAPATGPLADAPADLELAFSDIAAQLLALEPEPPQRREPPTPPPTPGAARPPTLTAAMAAKPAMSGSAVARADARVNSAAPSDAAAAVPVLQLEAVARPPRERAERRAATPEPRPVAPTQRKSQTPPMARDAAPAKSGVAAAARTAGAAPARPAAEAAAPVKRPTVAAAPPASVASPAVPATPTAQPARVALRHAPDEARPAMRDATTAKAAGPTATPATSPALAAAESPKPPAAAVTPAPASAAPHVARAAPAPASAVSAPAAAANPAPRESRPPLAAGAPATRSAPIAPKAAAAAQPAAPARTAPPTPAAAQAPPRAPVAAVAPASAVRDTAPVKVAAKVLAGSATGDVLPGPPPAIDSTQTLRALVMPETDGDADMLLVIQLATSDREFAPDSVPNLAIFNEYRLYTAVGTQQGKVMYALRLGFFSDRAPAEAVAGYLRSFFDEPAVTRISTEERERFGKRRVKARKESGETGVYASIELSSAPAAPSTSLADLSARTRNGASAGSDDEGRNRSPTRG